MYKKHQTSIAQKHFQKQKKYYSSQTVRKDKENIIVRDVSEIIEKLQTPQRFPSIMREFIKNQMPNSVVQAMKGVNKDEKVRLGVNSIHFFQQSQQDLLAKKELKKQMVNLMNKIHKNHKYRPNLHQQFTQLSLETKDYLEYYLTNFSGQELGRATQILKEEGKTVILLILRQKINFFKNNDTDISNRLFLAFKLNPFNDFQFVPWEKYVRIRKFESGDISRKDCSDFLTSYFFLSSKKSIPCQQFWVIFGSVFRKLTCLLDESQVEILLNKTKEVLNNQIPVEGTLSIAKLARIMIDEPFFIWYELVALVFL